MTKPFNEEEFGPREIVPASLKLIVQSAYYLKGKTRNLRPSLGQVSSCFDRSTLASVHGPDCRGRAASFSAIYFTVD